ncbi:MAG: hypothetical protein M3347_08135 [Armatimonadota bacterium]|nr:hypothetical protein [Armatimonadota bacterium]
MTALWALLAGSPSASASLATSSASASYEAVLWLLHSSAAEAPVRALVEQALAGHASSVDFPALPAEQVEALFSNLKNAPPLNLSAAPEIDPPSITKAANPSPLLFAQSTPVVCSYPSVTALRHDATRRLARHSLTSHEAGARSGIRTNRLRE